MYELAAIGGFGYQPATPSISLLPSMHFQGLVTQVEPWKRKFLG